MEGIPKHGRKGSYSFILPLVNMELLAFTDLTFFCTLIQSHRGWEHHRAQIRPILLATCVKIFLHTESLALTCRTAAIAMANRLVCIFSWKNAPAFANQRGPWRPPHLGVMCLSSAKAAVPMAALLARLSRFNQQHLLF